MSLLKCSVDREIRGIKFRPLTAFEFAGESRGKGLKSIVMVCFLACRGGVGRRQVIIFCRLVNVFRNVRYE